MGIQRTFCINVSRRTDGDELDLYESLSRGATAVFAGCLPLTLTDTETLLVTFRTSHSQNVRCDDPRVDEAETKRIVSKYHIIMYNFCPFTIY